MTTKTTKKRSASKTRTLRERVVEIRDRLFRDLGVKSPSYFDKRANGVRLKLTPVGDLFQAAFEEEVAKLGLKAERGFTYPRPGMEWRAISVFIPEVK